MLLPGEPDGGRAFAACGGDLGDHAARGCQPGLRIGLRPAGAGGLHGVNARGGCQHGAVVRDERGLDGARAEVDAESRHGRTCTPESIDCMSGRVVIVGSLNVDLVVGLERMPLPLLRNGCLELPQGGLPLMSTFVSLASACGRTSSAVDIFDLDLNPHGVWCCGECQTIIQSRSAWMDDFGNYIP